MSKRVYISNSGNAYILKSRWIRVKEKQASERSWMYDYADSCTEEDGKRIVYEIRHDGKHMIYEQFEKIYPDFIYDNNKSLIAYLSGWDSTAGLNPHPYYIEVSENDAEYIRLWIYAGDVNSEESIEDLENYCYKHNYNLADIETYKKTKRNVFK